MEAAGGLGGLRVSGTGWVWSQIGNESGGRDRTASMQPPLSRTQDGARALTLTQGACLCPGEVGWGQEDAGGEEGDSPRAGTVGVQLGWGPGQTQEGGRSGGRDAGPLLWLTTGGQLRVVLEETGKRRVAPWKRGAGPQGKGPVSVAAEEGKVSACRDIGEGRVESPRTMGVGGVGARRECPPEEEGKSVDGTERRGKTGGGRAGILKEGGQDTVWEGRGGGAEERWPRWQQGVPGLALVPQARTVWEGRRDPSLAVMTSQVARRPVLTALHRACWRGL